MSRRKLKSRKRGGFIDRARPLGMLTKKEERQFVETLSEGELVKLERARAWHRRTYTETLRAL